jgi:Tfp pilus assembly protein PilZ
MTKDFYIVRKHPRVNVDFFADWGWEPEYEYYDRVTSLSLGGCFLATKRELRAGDQIFLRLSDEALGKVDLKGAIRYQLRLMEGGPPTGGGIQFVDVTSDGEEKLQAVLENYL